MAKSEDKIADVIAKYPHIKDKLIEHNQKFSNLNNPVVFNTVGKFARIKDVAKVSGEQLEALLDFINKIILGNKS